MRAEPLQPHDTEATILHRRLSNLKATELQRLSSMADKPRKRGPKPLSPADKRRPLGIPLSPNEADELRAAAAAAGAPFTAWARAELLAAARRAARRRPRGDPSG